MARLLFDYRSAYFLITLILVYSFAVGWDNNAHLKLPSLVEDYGHFFFIGLIAAIIANSTGAGGGIVFFPAFVTLGLTTQQALATSLAIQCFGMTAGSLGWLRVRRLEASGYHIQWRWLWRVLAIALPANLAGLWLAQWALPAPAFSVHVFFSVFSLIVGFAVLLRRQADQQHGRWQALSTNECYWLLVMCFIGGIVTAWLSIGIGEILAVVLIFLGFRTNMAIAAAVMISAITVICAVPYHVWISGAVVVEVLMFAAPGAVIGGTLASVLAVKLGASRLKTAMALWIIISALIYLAISI
ncbi:hypothetical protein CHH28_02935 [Bacterioplanes sanyensis]|uniref:Probable membrane transporter protein n=1 Tax=Bacterioplanes sanyensis TaxID=1249553 RepID=A0A222FFA2_9GAMM|nr:sulfite exporter TauE/SafE family protein [Bacterioplanes sanyensis]ASP37688.1 hypothetical protein CHH28_02935 [Bacterioplanes sanyensis]